MSWILCFVYLCPHTCQTSWKNKSLSSSWPLNYYVTCAWRSHKKPIACLVFDYKYLWHHGMTDWYLRRLGDKTIPDEISCRCWPTTNQGVVDSLPRSPINKAHYGVFSLALTVGVPRWKVGGSKWNSAVRGICGTHEDRWQVENNQWVGNNRIWRHRHCTSSKMFFWIFPSEYHSNLFHWLFLLQLLITMMELHVIFLFSILGIFIFHSNSLEVEKQEGSFWF